jgi:Putative lumazine-binding
MRRWTLSPVMLVFLISSAVPQSADRDDVLQAMRVMFDGLARRDTALMATVLEPGARLVQTFSGDGGPQMRSVPMTDFLAAVGNPEGPPMEERYWDPDVRIQDNLATVWVRYAFFVAGELSHCGEDTFQLARTADGWKIVALADTQRREACAEGPG